MEGLQYCQADFIIIIRLRKLLCLVCTVSLIGNFLIDEVSAHGRLIEPPSRASMWRYGFDTPHDYNDHELYCGGFTRQWQRNNGKCGICGDAWDLQLPRPHETGGKYGNSVIVRRYRIGAIIPVKIELTANHRGYFEFRTCPKLNDAREVTQDCLNKYLLKGKNGTTRYYPEQRSRIFESYYKLPDGLTCRQCVFQWRYIAGNNWGDCGNGTGTVKAAVGCGPQEEFRACADIAIGYNEFAVSLPTHSPKISTTPFTLDSPLATESNDYWPEYNGPYLLLNFVIAGTCLLVVLAVLALLYTYYYHAGQAKKWLMASRLLNFKQQPPVIPPQHKDYYTIATNHIQI